MPPLPENTGVPADAPRPEFSPRDIEPDETPSPTLPLGRDDLGEMFDQAAPAPSAEPTLPATELPSDPAPSTEPLPESPTFPDNMPFEVTPAPEDDVELPANPFNSSQLDSLPKLLAGGLSSQDMRRWGDKRADQFKGRLLGVHESGAKLLREDGSIFIIPYEQLSRRDLVFVRLQVRGLRSTGDVAIAEKIEHAQRRLVAAADTLRDADATIRVTR
jgi:hypothetical protein